MNTVSHGRQIQRGEGIQEASGESSETAISKAHVIFLVAKFIDAVTEFVERLHHVFHDAGADDVVDKKAAHQKFHREIVNTADVAFRMCGESFNHPLDNHVLDSLGSGNPPITARCRYLVACKSEFQLVDDLMIELSYMFFFHIFPFLIMLTAQSR